MRLDIAWVVVGRLANSIFVLAALSLLIFLFMKAVPGDPVLSILGENLTTSEQYAEVREALGLDLPWYEQYFDWIWGAVQGDFGLSIITQEPILPLIVEKLKATIELAFFAVLFGTVFGVIVGAVAALKRNTFFDTVATVVSLIGISIPVFWLGILLIVIFAVKLGMAPTGGMIAFDTMITDVTGFPLLDAIITGNWSALRDLLSHLVLPAVTLGLTPAALIARTTRASVIEVMNEDYVKASMARGVGKFTVLRRHILRNAMIPVVTIIGGSIVTETVFSWPGLGREMINAIYANDYPVVQGAILVYAALIVLINMTVDITYMLIDPRVKL